MSFTCVFRFEKHKKSAKKEFFDTINAVFHVESSFFLKKIRRFDLINPICGFILYDYRSVKLSFYTIVDVSAVAKTASESKKFGIEDAVESGFLISDGVWRGFPAVGLTVQFSEDREPDFRQFRPEKPDCRCAKFCNTGGRCGGKLQDFRRDVRQKRQGRPGLQKLQPGKPIYGS